MLGIALELTKARIADIERTAQYLLDQLKLPEYPLEHQAERYPVYISLEDFQFLLADPDWILEPSLHISDTEQLHCGRLHGIRYITGCHFHGPALNLRTALGGRELSPDVEACANSSYVKADLL